jgi:DNA mismatch repair ATPase MutS
VKCVFAQRKGFSLTISAQEYEAAPPETTRIFVQVRFGWRCSSLQEPAKCHVQQAVKKGRTYTCTTSELNALNARLLDAAKDSLLLSVMVLDGCTASVRECLPALTAFSEAVSLLDMITNAFATLVSGSARPYVRPQLSVDGPLAIQNGRHPVACALMHEEGREFVANSTFLSDAASLVVLTGCNMSGKASALRLCPFCRRMRCLRAC